MNWIELIGYVGSGLVLISLTLSNIRVLRWINLSGAVFFVIYGWLIHATPVILMNGLIVCANLYHLWKLHKGTIQTDKNPMPASWINSIRQPEKQAYLKIAHLKQVYRKGWLQREIVSTEKVETVADHTFGVASLVLLLAPRIAQGLDIEKMLSLAILHDWAEALTGDITPEDKVNFAEKNRQERDALQKIVSDLPHGESMLGLWEEYANASSDEAKIVKELDKLDMALQAEIYQQLTSRDVGEFMEAARSQITTPLIKDLIG